MNTASKLLQIEPKPFKPIGLGFHYNITIMDAIAISAFTDRIFIHCLLVAR
ncbi:MAG: hypothetical protein RMY31_001640 [Dendronalium sp. ChiSLP03b]